MNKTTEEENKQSELNLLCGTVCRVEINPKITIKHLDLDNSGAGVARVDS